jgi:Zn-dependent M28 family amino/carboxypeptidase
MRPAAGIVALGIVLSMAARAPQLAPVTSAVIDAPALLGDLRVLSADDMEGRRIGTPGGAKARAFLVERLAAAGLAPVGGGSLVMPFTAPTGTPGANVAGLVRGTRLPARYLVVSAHYDHIGVQRGVVYNGADDNASGAAALVAITKYFVAHRPAHSLLIAAFDGEEEGLLGSRAFVRAPPVPPDAIVIDLNIDMIGRDSRNTLYVVGTRAQPALVPVIARVARRAPVTLLMGHDNPADRREDEWTDESDQFAFLTAGIPALYFGVEDEAEHHQSTDDFATITRGFYVRAVETVIDVIREFDADPPGRASRVPRAGVR